MYNKALDIFIAAADSGSFTKASEHLFLSHTAVIKQINNLEKRLGVRLFQRSNQGAVLTPAGQRLYQKAKEIIAFSDRAVREIQQEYGVSPVTLRVGTSLFYPCHIFIDLWDSVSSLCPRYQLQIVPIDNDARRFSGLNRQYDFIVGPYNSEIAGTAYPFIPIGEYRFCLSLPRRHPLAKRDCLSFSDLDGQKLMIMAKGNSAVNDQIRSDIISGYPSIQIEDIPPHYNIQTFNQCAGSNSILLSLECWKNVHPELKTIPLRENYMLPYGIVTAQNPPPELAPFIRTLKECLAGK